jgi:hypothetical protein
VAVTLSVLNPSNYPELALPAEDSEKISIWKLPKLLWIGLAIFFLNIVIGTGTLKTPEIQIDAYGKEVQRAYASGTLKPSPFAVTVDTAKHKVRLAAKVYPASFTFSAVGQTQPTSYEGDLPVRTEPAVYTQGSQPAVYNADHHYQVIDPRRAPSATNGKIVLIN